MRVNSLHITPDYLVALMANSLCDGGLGIEMLAGGIDCVPGLHDFPNQVILNHAALVKLIAPAFKSGFPRWCSQGGEVPAIKWVLRVLRFHIRV